MSGRCDSLKGEVALPDIDMAAFWRFHGQTDPAGPLDLRWIQHQSSSSGPPLAPVQLTLSGSVSNVRWRSSGLSPASVETGLDRLLGRHQPVDSALERLQHHAREQGLTCDWPGAERLRLWPMATPFEAGVRAVISQQISVKAAQAIRARLLAAMPPVAGVPLFTPSALQNLTANAYRACGLSASKARALQALAAAGLLPCDWQPPELTESKAVAVTRDLIELPGIGPWTAQYTLVRGFGYADADLSGDMGVRAGLRVWYQQTDVNASALPDSSQARDWLDHFRPYRTHAAAFLWWLTSGGMP